GERTLDKTGFRDYQGGSAVPTRDGGFVVFVLSYVHASWGAVARFVKLDAAGKQVWERQLRGDGSVNTPFPGSRVQLTPAGTIALKGHIYIDPPGHGDRPTHAWSCELGADGKILSDEIGGVIGPAETIDR